MKKLLLSLTLAVAFIAPQANATPVNWGSSSGSIVTDSGIPSDFDFGTLTFNTSFVASSIDSITSSSGSFFHGHGSPNTFNIDVNLNGVWTHVYTSAIVDNSTPDEIYFNGLITPGNEILFTSGVVSGLRIYGTNYVGFAFHSFNNNGTTFNFGNLGGAGVPAPGALALMGLGLLGLGASRRRKAA